MFVCTNERGPDDARGSCSARGSAEVLAALKQKANASGLKRIVRVNKAGCLDQCARGVTVVVYPEGVWYGGVTLADVDELAERHLVGGEPVRRLEIPAHELTGKEAPPGFGQSSLGKPGLGQE
ncbi:MAG: (2Fe-2S) ferredoxin domain-containing protein [Planctomycetes bacterium]|nr:(2Fe-2S) ferredoxin domain-containing protein [Planctomycetota bacterium]